MASIRHGTPADHPVLLERVLQSFSDKNPTHPPFEELYPDSIRPTADAMGQWLVAEVDGEIAAGMQVVPRPLVLAGSITLPASGLGNVFCYPPFRGQGLMSELLKEVARDTERREDAINMLGGDRLRYGTYGWEHAGASRRLQLSSAMRRRSDTAPVSVLDVRRWRGAEEDVKRMYAAYLRLPYRTDYSLDRFSRVLLRPNNNVWLCDDANEGFAYTIVSGNQLREYAGEPAALDRLVRFLLKSRALHVDVPPVDAETKLERILLGYAQHFSVAPVGMVRIVSLLRILDSFLPLLQTRLAGWNGECALEIEGQPIVSVRGTGSTVTLAEGDDATPAIAVSAMEMSRLLFGPFPPAVDVSATHLEFLRRAFPLPLYWHSLSHV